MNNIICDIESLFPVEPEFQVKYVEKINQAAAFCRNQKIVILCLARNIEAKCSYSFRQLRLLLENFHPDSMVQIYENDSVDNTVGEINKIISRKEYKQFKLTNETLNTVSMPLSRSRERTCNMANARNKCYNLIDNINLYDFVVVVDIDFLNISLNGILNSFGWMKDREDIKAMCGNSYLLRPDSLSEYNNYDSFAFRLNYWHIRAIPWFGIFNLGIGSDPINVYSGFGGCCIYRQEYYAPVYSGEDCEHVMLHKNLTDKYPDFKLYYNPSQIMIVD